MELGFKSFVTENELDQKRRIRQELWEANRRPDQPLEAPEEEYDPRTLFERLKEQKDRKQEEFDESRKLKHLIRGLDNDEITFLEMVDENKYKEEELKMKEEENTIKEFQNHLVKSTVSEHEKKLMSLKNQFSKLINQI